MCPWNWKQHAAKFLGMQDLNILEPHLNLDPAAIRYYLVWFNRLEQLLQRERESKRRSESKERVTDLRPWCWKLQNKTRKSISSVNVQGGKQETFLYYLSSRFMPHLDRGRFTQNWFWNLFWVLERLVVWNLPCVLEHFMILEPCWTLGAFHGNAWFIQFRNSKSDADSLLFFSLFH